MKRAITKGNALDSFDSVIAVFGKAVGIGTIKGVEEYKAPSFTA